jgi:predicted DNA binding protein
MEAAGRTVGVTLRRVYPLRSQDTEPVARGWELTSAQEEALRAAWGLGYFQVPRAATASEVAEELGISKTAFLERLRRGQASVFGSVFGEEG